MYESIRRINRSILNKVVVGINFDDSLDSNEINIKQLGDKTLELFEKCIDESSSELLKELIIKQNLLITNLEEKTGWLILQTGACYFDNCLDLKSINNPQCGYYIPRNENGFYLKSEREKIKPDEMSFFIKYNNDLNVINNIMYQIEQIMGGNYQLGNNYINAKYVCQLAKSLGYEQLSKAKDKCKVFKY